jgi:hypothetical protein
LCVIGLVQKFVYERWTGDGGRRLDIRQGGVRLGNDALSSRVCEKWDLIRVHIGMQEDLSVGASAMED